MPAHPYASGPSGARALIDGFNDAIAHHERTIDDDARHLVAERRVDDGRDRIVDRRHEWIVAIDNDQVGLLADFDRADLVAETDGMGTVNRRHFQDLFRGHDGCVLMRAFLDQRREFHRLEKAVIVAARRAVRPQADGHAGYVHFRDRRNAGSEIEIAAGIMGYLDALVLENADVVRLL